MLFGLFALTGATLTCTIPTSINSEGLVLVSTYATLNLRTFLYQVVDVRQRRCVQCFSYSIDDVETGEFTEVTVPPTVEDCREDLRIIFGDLVNSLDDATILSLCSLLVTKFTCSLNTTLAMINLTLCTCFHYFYSPATTIQVPVTEKRCIVNTTVVYSDCIDSNDTIFVVKTPNVTGANAKPTACFWSTPSLDANEKIYVDTLRMDIQGNPSTSCDDKIIIESDNANDDRVACGTANQPVFYNKLINDRVDPFYVSNNTAQRDGAEILFVYYEEPTKRKVSSYHCKQLQLIIFISKRSRIDQQRSAVTLNSTTGEAAIDICAPPNTENTIYPVCTCKTLPTPIDQL